MKTDNINKSLVRALQVLNLFTPGRLESTLTEISQISGLAPATTYRILSTLAQAKYLEKSESTGKYRVGPQAYMLGMLYLNVSDVLQHVDPVLDLLSELTGERIGLSVLDSEHAHTLLIRERNSVHPIRFIEPPGVNYMAHATANGKMLLSELPHAELLRMYPQENLDQHTPATVSTREDLLRELERIRDSGLAYSHGESVSHVWAVSSPVRNSEGAIVASLHIAAPAVRIDHAERESVASLVKAAGRLASSRLGWRGVDSFSLNEDTLRSLWTARDGGD